MNWPFVILIIRDSILNVQEKRIKNADRLARFRFIKRAVTPVDAVRDSFFISLSDPANRRPEPWVTEALHYFHHPLREKYSIKYLRPALDLLPEIQRPAIFSSQNHGSMLPLGIQFRGSLPDN